MKKIILFFAVLMFTCAGVALGGDRDLLVHASADSCWYAKVGKPPYPSFDPNGPMEQTEIYARQNGPGQAWHLLKVRPNRVVAMACESSQLAVLERDGQWTTISADACPTGQVLPAKGVLKTIGDDGSNLWAIGSVIGGITAANDAIKKDPATRPTTAPMVLGTAPETASTSPADMGIPPAPVPRLVVFRMQSGRWTTVTELPREKDIASEDDLSLVVVGGKPMVAFKSGDGKIQIIRYGENHRWEDVLIPALPQNNPVKNFSLFSDGYDPYFWQTTGNVPGEMFVNVSGKSPPLKLDWATTNETLDGTPAATFSGGYVCVFGPHGNPTDGMKILEQRYERSGKPFETAAALTVASSSSERLFPAYLEIVFLCMMGFSVGASVFQQWNQSEKPSAAITLVPAALFPRFLAGMIDLLPVIAALAVIFTATTAADDLEQLPSLKGMCIFAGGVLVYLLHTTLTEARTGRSVGKWLTGLKVVTVDGNMPDRSQLMIRNLLRVVDPLVMILVSPLRQRSADTIAGTIVIEVDVQAELDPLDQAEPKDELENEKAE